MISPYNLWCQKIIPCIPETKICVDSIEVLPFQAVHSDGSAVSVKIFTPTAVIGYTGDTKYTRGIADHFEGVDILIMNTKHSRGERSNINLSIDDAEKMIKIVSPSLAILTHFGKKLHSENPLYEAREIQRSSNVQTIVASDGLSIIPESYSAKLKTRTLNLYK